MLETALQNMVGYYRHEVKSNQELLDLCPFESYKPRYRASIAAYRIATVQLETIANYARTTAIMKQSIYTLLLLIDGCKVNAERRATDKTHDNDFRAYEQALADTYTDIQSEVTTLLQA